MTGAPRQTNLGARAMLASLRAAHGLPTNPASAPTWTFNFAGFTATLPNFRWRRAAIDTHDLHHLMLGEPFTTLGECQVATWEFAAGAFPDPRARLFCLPLVAFGAAMAPGRTWRSFAAGCVQRSLHGQTIDDATTLDELYGHIQRPRTNSPRRMHKAVRFGALMVASAALYVVPAALAYSLFTWLIN